MSNTTQLSNIKAVLEQLRTNEDSIKSLNDRLKALKKTGEELESKAIRLMAQGGYKGQPMRLGGYRYTLSDKSNRDGFSQHIVKTGLEQWLKSRNQSASLVDDIMNTINSHRKVSYKPSLIIEKV